MRDLEAFNTDLLAKQCWRLISNPTSLAATVLKGKYFPRTSLWEAKVPQNASYTWRSVLSARSLLERGSRWIVGNGHNIRFWKDAWVPNIPGGRVLAAVPANGNTTSTVRDWLDDDGRSWNIQLLQQHLSKMEVQAIKCIPLADHNQQDY